MLCRGSPAAATYRAPHNQFNVLKHRLLSRLLSSDDRESQPGNGRRGQHQNPSDAVAQPTHRFSLNPSSAGRELLSNDYEVLLIAGNRNQRPTGCAKDQA